MGRWILGAAIAALVAGGVVVVAATRDGGDESPERWDRRVAELARFVEDERGLDFDHAVAVEFLSADEFRTEVTNDDELSAEDADELDHVEGLFRALGLVEGDLDLRASVNQISGEQVIGLYNPETDRILVRGDRITPGMRPTIVHELTHALQDQHYDLETEYESSGADAAFGALVEADAMRIERAYVESLDEQERATIDDERRDVLDDVDLEGVPPILDELFSLPYVLGPPFIEAVIADGGDDAVDATFRRPPTSEEQVVDPDAYLGNDRPAKVATPALRKGEKMVGEPDDFGMVSLLLVLGERLRFSQAWDAVTGWKGDAYVGFRRDGRDCIRVRTRLDSRKDADELHAAVQAWAEGTSSTAASRRGTVVEFTSCDPGREAARAAVDQPRTLDVLQLRQAIVGSLAANGLNRRDAGCVTDLVLHGHDAGELLALDEVTDENDPRIIALQREVAAGVAHCRGG